jgi:hypothetical protein
MWKTLAIVLAALVGLAAGAHIVVPRVVLAQHPPMTGAPHGGMAGAPMQHREHMAAMMAGREATQPGQQAFGTIAEIVRLLDADPQTDWSKVDLERLRRHLVDMDEVVMRATVRQTAVPGGLAMEVTGTGRTEQAIQAMVVPHGRELDRLPAYAAKTEPIPGGVRLTVTARSAEDAKAVARLRGLGFIGLLTEGGHHAAHHLAMARGENLDHAH